MAKPDEQSFKKAIERGERRDFLKDFEKEKY